jgi:hypothetical protein
MPSPAKLPTVSAFEILLGSKVRARALRFFVQNTEREYSLGEIVSKTLGSRADVLKEVARLVKIGFVKEIPGALGKNYQTVSTHVLYPELRSLATKESIDAQAIFLRRMKSLGDVRLALFTGIFINYPKSKVDMLLVISHVQKKSLQRVIAEIEAELGREVRYMLLTPEEFKYRLNMLDRFLIEFFEQPHQEAVQNTPELKRFLAGIQRG